MKRALFVGILFTVALAGCVNRPNIDYSKVDPECGRKCLMNDEACTSRYAAFPLMLQSNCNPQVEACVKACPPNNASTTSETNSESVATPSNKPSVSDKLKELASLHKQGLITDSEYAAKKQEILKSM